MELGNVTQQVEQLKPEFLSWLKDFIKSNHSSEQAEFNVRELVKREGSLAVLAESLKPDIRNNYILPQEMEMVVLDRLIGLYVNTEGLRNLIQELIDNSELES